MNGALVGMSTLAAFLQREIAQQGWSLRQAAEKLEISKTALRNILKGADVVPNLETLQRLARGLKVPLGHLIVLCGFDLDDEQLTIDEQKRIRLIIASLSHEQAAALLEAIDRIHSSPDKIAQLQGYLDRLLEDH